MGSIYQIKKWWKWLLLTAAVSISAVSLIYTSVLVSELKEDEKKKMEVWARAYEIFGTFQEGDPYLDFVSTIIENNTTVPVIAVNDWDSKITLFKNINDRKADDPEYMRQLVEAMKLENEPIQVLSGIFDEETGEEYTVTLYYSSSTLLNKLQYFPLVMLAAIALFIALAYWAFSTSRESEQNQVWAGMARETAHQIGTPLSSLMGWFELLKLYDVPEDTLSEIQKDISRLQVITDRFSKIGAKPGLDEGNIVPVVKSGFNYLKRRSSKRIDFEFVCEEKEIQVNFNEQLFSWVVENLIRNSVDAMDGSGKIAVHLFSKKNNVYMDVSDTGKGIKSSRFTAIFEPGFTTKTRGWGLGLSLVRRIVKDYHKGQVFVLRSEVNVGSTFRVILKKA